MPLEDTYEETYKKITIVLSIIVPIAVILLFNIRIPGYDLTFLPPIYATINGFTAIFLIFAVYAIKTGRKVLHEKIIYLCLFLSLTFLILYIAYHMTSDSTVFGGTGVIAYIYYFILISHIILSVIIIPLVLFAVLKAQLENFEGHKKLVKYTFPLWLYVAISGVIIYLMIAPYYK